MTPGGGRTTCARCWLLIGGRSPPARGRGARGQQAELPGAFLLGIEQWGVQPPGQVCMAPGCLDEQSQGWTGLERQGG